MKYLVLGSVDAVVAVEVNAESEEEAMLLAEGLPNCLWDYTTSHPDSLVTVDCAEKRNNQ